MKEKNDVKKMNAGTKDRDVLMHFDATFYALAGYLAQYVSLLRHAAAKPLPR